MIQGDFQPGSISASFGNDGLLIYQDGSINLLLGWQYHDEQPSYARKICLEAVPPIPSEAEIHEISVSESGQYVSIIANGGVFVLVLFKDLWQNYGFYNAESVIERLRDHYYVKCHSIHPLVYSGENAIPVVKHRWLSVDDTKHIIAILSEDNTVRLFELGHYEEKNTKVPVLIIDFRNMASSADHFFADQKERKTFGLHKAATSFDFGPVITDSLSDIKLHSIFVADTEGEIFYAAFSVDDYRCTGPVGALCVKMAKGSGSMLGCDIADIKYIRHWYSQIAPVFAVASSNGKVYHLIVNQVMDEFDEDEFCYGSMLKAYVTDVFQFDVSHGVIALTQDDVFESKYLIRSERAVALMDVSDTVHDMWKVGCNESTEKRNSRFFEHPSLFYLAVVPDGSATNYFVSLSCIRLVTSGEKQDMGRFVMLARTKGDKLVTKALTEVLEPSEEETIPQNTVHNRRNAHKKEDPSTSNLCMPQEVTNFRSISIPVTILDDASEDQQVATIKGISAVLTDACQSLCDVMRPFNKCAQRMHVEFSTLEDVKNESYAKMMATFNELVDLKMRLVAVRTRVERKQELRNKVIRAIQHASCNKPLTLGEQQMYANLKSYQSRINQIKSSAPELQKKISKMRNASALADHKMSFAKISPDTELLLKNSRSMSHLRSTNTALNKRLSNVLDVLAKTTAKNGSASLEVSRNGISFC
ncbi:hypothetical protein QR680_001300 [Steinernema hermaphroditum]|uniref:Nucleoporin Nup88 n=1 Tax=Steinernema hermaphroditum TaxID=289476 RepID=A0AA39GYK2_9BILA|nr:hypothetical protein QR680_001300 [Steinernema hermaphroditum]